MSRPCLETLRRAPVAWHPLSAQRNVYRYTRAGMEPRTLQACRRSSCPQEAPAGYLQQYLAMHPLGGIATRRRAALEPIRLEQFLCALSSPRFLSPAKSHPTPPCFVFPIHCLSFLFRLRRNLQVLFPPSVPRPFPSSPPIHRHPAHSTNCPPGDVVPPFDFSTQRSLARQRLSVENPVFS